MVACGTRTWGRSGFEEVECKYLDLARRHEEGSFGGCVRWDGELCGQWDLGEARQVVFGKGQQNLTGLSLDGTEQGDLCLPPYSSSSLGCPGTGLNPGAVSGQRKVSAAGPVPTGGLNSTLGTRNVLVGRRLGEAGFPPRHSRVRGLGACAVCAAPGLGQSHRDIPLAAPAAGGWHLCEE